MKNKTLSDKKFWVQDYDLDNLKQQILEGKDDCIVLWANVSKDMKKLMKRLIAKYPHYVKDSKSYKKLCKETNEIFREELK